jgi:hypothetical protein
MAKTKEPWVSVKFTCKLNNKPKKHAGITSETFGIAYDKPVPLSTMIVGFAINLSEFYYATTDINMEQIKEQLKTAASCILNLEVYTKEAGNQ